MSKRVPETLPGYDTDRLDRILDVLGRASKDPSDNRLPRLLSLREELEAELLSLIHGSGLAYGGSEASAYWHELRSTAPSHKTLAARVPGDGRGSQSARSERLHARPGA